MQANEKLNVTIPEGYNGEPIKIELREGKAGAQVDEPVISKVIREGIITSAEEYILKHYGDVLKKGTLQPGIVVYSLDPKKLFINFDEFPNHPVNGARINGKAELNPEILEWKVNSNAEFDAQTVIKIIRKQAHNFASVQEAKELIKTLQNFEAVFTTERKRADDRRGNVEDAIKETIKNVKGELPAALKLQIPIFKGGTPVPMSLEIELDRDGAEVVYSFYSLELEATLREAARTAINASVDKFRPAFVCIEQA